MDGETARRLADTAPELFLQHTAALRALARALVGDGEAADDAVQATWLEWLRRPPRDASKRGAWLARVLRSKVIDTRREAERREAREKVVARPERADPRVRLEREETLRAVVAAVLALPPAQKEVVWLRYFEDQPPRAIAEQMRAPVETIYERLRDGHELLRTRLAREFGSPERRDARLGVLIGPLALASSTANTARLARTIASGSLPLAPLALLGIVILIAVGATIASWFGSRGDDSSPSEPARPRATGAVQAVVAPEGEPDASAVAREVLDEPQTREIPVQAPAPSWPAWTWPAPNYVFDVEFSVLDTYDAPAEGVAVYAAPAGGTLNRVASTDADGIARVRWRARWLAAELDVSLGAVGELPIVRVPVQYGETRIGLRARVADEVGGPKRRPRKRDDLKATPSATVWPSAPTAPVDGDGFTLFVEPLHACPAGSEPSEPESAPAFGAAPPSDRGSRMEAERGGVAVIVTDDRRREIESALVRARKVGASGPWLRALTDWRGNAEFHGLDIGEYEVVASSASHGRGATLITVSSQRTDTWFATLEPGHRLTGEVRSATAEAKSSWRVLLERRAPSYALLASIEADAKGRWCMAGIDAAAARLLLMPRDSSWPLPIVASEGLRFESGSGLSLSAPAFEVRARLRFRVKYEGGDALEANPSALLRRTESDCGAPFAPAGSTTTDTGDVVWSYEMLGVPAGDYELVLRASGVAEAQVLPLRILDGRELDLAEFRFAPDQVLPMPMTTENTPALRLRYAGALFETVSSPLRAAPGRSIAVAEGDFVWVDAGTLLPPDR